MKRWTPFSITGTVRQKYKKSIFSKKWVNYRFKEAELAPGKMSDMLQDLVYFSTIPFFEYLHTTREDKRKALKDLFLKRLGEFFDEALENDMPIEEVIQAKKARDFYSFMESLYSSWLKDSDLQTDMLIHELRDYAFVGLQPAFEEYYTLQAVFENNTGDQRRFPLSLIYYYDNASDYLLGRTATLSLYPNSGLRKFFWGGKSAVMAETPELQKYVFDPAAYGRVIFGFPVWASNFAPPIRTFIKENDLTGKRFAVFACESGSGAEKAFTKLKDALGIDKYDAELILIDPKSKPNVENDRKIDSFCAALL